jgi:hypothetical protein
MEGCKCFGTVQASVHAETEENEENSGQPAYGPTVDTGTSVYEAGLFSTRLRRRELLPDPLSHGKVLSPVKAEKTFNDTPVWVGKYLRMIIVPQMFQ